MKRLAVALGFVFALSMLAASSASAESPRLKNPFVGLHDSEAIRALPATQLKDPFARPAPSAAVKRLPEARLKDPFASAERAIDALPPAQLKNPFAR